MGYSYSVVPQSILNGTSFYSTTDVLIVTTGTGHGVYSSTQIANIQGFIENGGSVYFQSEYDCSYSSNSGISTILSNLGANFTWNGTVAGDLIPALIDGCMATKPDGTVIPDLNYYWYGCESSSPDLGYEGFLTYNGKDIAFTYCSSNPNHGMLISSSDQDWVRVAGNYPNAEELMEQIIYRLGSAPDSCP